MKSELRKVAWVGVDTPGEGNGEEIETRCEY